MYMKRLFCCFVQLISILIICNNAFAQNDSSYFKYSLKTNAFQWFVNEANIVVEQRFSRHFGIESTLGIYGIVRPMDDQDYNSYSLYIPYKGFALRINPKYYFYPEKKANGNAYYLSPMLLLKNVSVNKYRNTPDSYEHFVAEREVAGVSLLLGNQFIVAKRLIFDLYFGPGYRYTSDEDPEHALSGNAGIKIGYTFSPKQFSSPGKSAETPVVLHRFAVKINTLPLIINEQNLGFEYRFNKRFGLEASLGTNSIFKANGRYAKYRAESYDKSYTLRVNPKVYFGRIDKGLQFYISPMYLHKYLKDFEATLYPSGAYIEDGIEKSIHGGSILLGYQRNLNKHLLGDIFVGFGKNYFTGYTSGIYSNMSYGYPLDGNESVFNFGVKLGYGFKPM